RGLHRVPDSRELAWVVRTLGPDAYEDSLGLDEQVTYTPRMAVARARVEDEIARSFAVAEASRVEHTAAGVQVVAAVCVGYPSEIADAWGKDTPGTVFALYDVTGLAVSLRRSPDRDVDPPKGRQAPRRRGHPAPARPPLPQP